MIFLDDVLTSPSSGGTFPAKYPSNAAWENAMVSFVAAVGQAVRANGYYLLVNAGAISRRHSEPDCRAVPSSDASRVMSTVS